MLSLPVRLSYGLAVDARFSNSFQNVLIPERKGAQHQNETEMFNCRVIDEKTICNDTTRTRRIREHKRELRVH